MRIRKGIVILVTGGASGLGEATVRQMYSKGASVAVIDNNLEKMQALQAELDDGERLLFIKCNVAVEEQVKKAVDDTVAKFGTIHVALACAGVAWMAPMLSKKGAVLNTDIFRSVIQINVLGSVYMAKYAALAMSKNEALNKLEGEKGVIILVSSVAGEEAQRAQAGYGASKGAINGMVLPMARDLGKYRIRVLAIAPGVFHTPISNQFQEWVLKKILAEIPLGRTG